MSSVPRLILALGCALSVYACSQFPLHRNSLPVEGGQFGGGLPPGYEFQAVLTVERNEASREYLMALRTDSDEARMALMTPQGLPLYIVTGSGGSMEVERQIRFEHLLTPDMVARYLLMIYGSREFLTHSATDSNWQLEVTPGGRSFFSGDETPGAIEVRYLGEAPWYKEVTISDDRNNARMTIQTLEWFDAVPE